MILAFKNKSEAVCFVRHFMTAECLDSGPTVVVLAASFRVSKSALLSAIPDQDEHVIENKSNRLAYHNGNLDFLAVPIGDFFRSRMDCTIVLIDPDSVPRETLYKLMITHN